MYDKHPLFEGNGQETSVTTFAYGGDCTEPQVKLGNVTELGKPGHITVEGKIRLLAVSSQRSAFPPAVCWGSLKINQVDSLSLTMNSFFEDQNNIYDAHL